MQIVTANRLKDGVVVYLTAANDWSEHLDAAVLYRASADAEAALALAKRAVEDRLIVAPYLVDVVADGGCVRPTSMREHIRAAHGPTFTPDTGSWSGRIEV